MIKEISDAQPPAILSNEEPVPIVLSESVNIAQPNDMIDGASSPDQSNINTSIANTEDEYVY